MINNLDKVGSVSEVRDEEVTVKGLKIRFYKLVEGGFAIRIDGVDDPSIHEVLEMRSHGPEEAKRYFDDAIVGAWKGGGDIQKLMDYAFPDFHHPYQAMIINELRKDDDLEPPIDEGQEI